MIRELVLVSADLSATPWAASRAPPMPQVPAGFVLETVSAASDAGLFATGPVTSVDAAQRLSEGDRCLVVLGPSGGLAAQMWCSEQTRFIDWIGCNIGPPAGHVHVYNAWVRPEFRGLNLQWTLASASCRDIVRRGRTLLCAGVERKEFPPFARKYAAMGLALIAPYKSIWSWRVFGVTAAVIATPPPRSLEAASRNARDIFAGRAEAV